MQCRTLYPQKKLSKPEMVCGIAALLFTGILMAVAGTIIAAAAAITVMAMCNAVPDIMPKISLRSIFLFVVAMSLLITVRTLYAYISALLKEYRRQSH